MNEVIAFRTERSGEGPLIWAQLAIWDVLRWLPPGDTTLNLLATCPVPGGTDLDGVLGAVRRLVERHDSLRTVYRDAGDGPRQHVLGAGAVPLTLVELEDRGLDEVAAEAGEAMRAPAFDIGADLPLRAGPAEAGEAMRAPAFDIGADLPLRAGVLTRDGEPRLVLLAASHMAVDAASLALVRADLEALLRGDEDEVGEQPLERVAYETSEAGRRREAKALRYWSRHLATLPDRLLERPPGPPGPDLDWGFMQSPALAAAAGALAARHAVPPATVLLAATTLQLAAYLGEDEAALRMIVSTRFRAASRSLVAAFNSNALFRLGLVPDEDVGGLLRRGADAALTAYAHCEYNPRALDALVAEEVSRRGITGDGYCYFNDTRDRAAAPMPEPEPDLAERIRDLLPQTKLYSPVIDRLPKHANFFLFLLELGDTADLMLGVQHGFFGRRGPLGFLADLERTTVHATDDGVTAGDLYAAAR